MTTAQAANEIMAADITNWNNAYAWGNHASAGYLTSETDPIVKAVNGLVKSNGAAISAAVAGTDYIAPYGSQTAKYFLAAPNGADGLPSFRAIAASDIPTLNQNTTGTASNVTGIVAIANGGTGATSKSGAFDALSPMTTSGDMIIGGAAGTGTRLAAGSTGQILRVDGSSLPSWSQASYPFITTANNILYSSANNTISELTTANNSVLITNASGVPSMSATLPVVNLPAGTMVLINANEVDISNTITTPGAVTYNLVAADAANYSKIMVEAEIGLVHAGASDGDWSFTMKYGGVTVETVPLRSKGNSPGFGGSGGTDAHNIGAVIKYSSAFAGGNITIDVTAITQNGTWYIRSFRVYGIK
jgi:hypothetical protein